MIARTRVKICGITTAEAARWAIDAGADAVGFVLAESPRRVTPELAEELSRAVGAYATTVGVYRSATEADVARALDELGLDRVQMDAAPAFALSSRYRMRVVPVVRVGTADWADHAARCASEFATMLIEGPTSGAGVAVDWSLVAPWARRGRVVLAGGLSPSNVGRAVAEVGPWGVDVSSGVEASPGVKDERLVNAFVEAVTRADAARGRASKGAAS